MEGSLPAGKLPPEILGRLLSTIQPDPSVIIGPGLGRDAAAVRIGEHILVLKTDPITFATDQIGWYAPNVNANDIACMGATPRWMLVTALMQEANTTPEAVERIFIDLQEACAAIGVSLIGGHSEITVGLDRTILVGCMAGEATEEELVDPRRSRVGDAVILARGIAIEGTALIAAEFSEQLKQAKGQEFVQRCLRFLREPGISVVSAARLLRDTLGPDLHAMHDPTEGGIATGLHELAAAAGTGITVERASIPIYPETDILCEHFGLDPLGLISSGALLAVVAPGQSDRAVSVLSDAGIPAAQIGTLTDDTRMRLRAGGSEHPLPEFAVDEIARLFSQTEG